MARKSDKKERLLRSAKSLIHRQGYLQTTLADIAGHSGVPLGNIYYYFKSKEQIAQAIVDERTDNFRALALEWEKDPDPRNRLLSFLEMPATLSKTITKHGCPVGGLSQEFNKIFEAGPNIGSGTLQAHIDWVTEQFRLMGKPDAEELGCHFIATLQGSCLLANTLKKPEMLNQQILRLRKELNG